MHEVDPDPDLILKMPADFYAFAKLKWITEIDSAGVFEISERERRKKIEPRGEIKVDTYADKAEKIGCRCIGHSQKRLDHPQLFLEEVFQPDLARGVVASGEIVVAKARPEPASHEWLAFCEETRVALLDDDCSGLGGDEHEDEKKGYFEGPQTTSRLNAYCRSDRRGKKWEINAYCASEAILA